MRRRWSLLAVLAFAVVPVISAGAQVSIAIPNINNPIQKARGAVAKTDAQTRAAEREGNAKQPGNEPLAAEAAKAADQQKKAAAPAGKAAQGKAPAGTKAQGKAPAGGMTKMDTVLNTSRRGTASVMREAFTYDAGGRRDPFVSLMASGELRPIITDLVLTGVIHDSDARRSIAMLVDVSTGEGYQVHIGQTLGRMKVTRIGVEDVTLNIDEFGLSRSETLTIDKTRKGPAAGQRRP